MNVRLTNARLRPLGTAVILLAAMLVPAAVLAQPVQAAVEEYAQAKARADADEAALPALAASTLRAAQERLSQAGVAQCATQDPDLSAFVIVAQLDAEGRVARTWRQGDSPLAACFEQQVAARQLPAPPAAPFYVSFEMSFTP